ncbi:MAG: hypothetical protein RMJ44_12475, partial [Cytophagales bacterium]|nr:hypothetical protein [Cytophagales bacterium]
GLYMKVNKEVNRLLRTLRSLGMCNSLEEALEWLSDRIWVRIYEGPMYVWAAYINSAAFVCNPDFVEIRVTFNKVRIIIDINNYAIVNSELSEPESRRFVFENNIKYPAVEPLDILKHIEDLRCEEYAQI